MRLGAHLLVGERPRAELSQLLPDAGIVRRRAERSVELHERFPLIVGPQREDICYATTNRQEAVKRIAPVVDALIVVGSSNSSNSQRLKEVAERSGCPLARLVLRADDVEWNLFHLHRW